MAETSPEWKKPSDVMKFRRRSSSTAVAGKPVASPTSRSLRSPDSSETKSHKRKNPFACSQVNALTECDAEGEEVINSCGADVNAGSQRSQLDKICVSYFLFHIPISHSLVHVTKYDFPH